MKYYCDGFLYGGKNPSDIGGGYTIVNQNNELIKREEILKTDFSNNEGEILGILNAARIAGNGDTISSDSMTAIWWARKKRSKARSDLNPLLVECFNLIWDKQLELIWEGRELNLAGLYNEKMKSRKWVDLQSKQKACVVESLSPSLPAVVYARTPVPSKAGLTVMEAHAIAVKFGNAPTEEEMFPPAEKNKTWVDTYLGKVRL